MVDIPQAIANKGNYRRGLFAVGDNEEAAAVQRQMVVVQRVPATAAELMDQDKGWDHNSDRVGVHPGIHRGPVAADIRMERLA